MFFDLNFPVHHPQQSSAQNLSKKSKGKQPQQTVDASYSPAQIGAVEARLNLLVHLGYTVIALNQTVQTAVVPKSHVNILDGLVAQLKPRPGVILLKRLTIILDQESEKGFGLTPANAAIFKPYDLLALVPTTQPTFSLACLTHSQPSVLTAHIISLPLTLRLDFRMKHTLVRTALKNGAVFEINYVGALGGDNDAVLVEAGAAENGASAKQNWWATAKEVTRVTKGKGLIVSGGVVTKADLRAPRDVSNLITLLGLPQDASHSASTKIPKSLVLRAQTRQTYRAVFSEPVLVIPEGSAPAPTTIDENSTRNASESGNEKKRPREEEVGNAAVPDPAENSSRKKKRKKNNQETR
ncbi:PHP domain-like protein [Mycena crocata]|nr:PHP domain-like protein [Mycena crocata]